MTNNKKKSRLVRVIGLGLGSALATAPPVQAAGESPELAFFEALPVVLSVSRLSQPQSEAPAAVTVIDREMIKASGYREVWELFNLVPGFNAAYAPNESPEVIYHGASGQFNRRMQVLVDGRSYFSPFFYGGVNWRLLPVVLDDIERIEVVRGSNSAAYGSNAFLGIANIVTRSGAETPAATVQAATGQQGVSDQMLRGAWQGQDGSLRLSLQQRRDSGIDSENDDQATRIAEIRVDSRINLTDTLRIALGGVEADYQVGKQGGSGSDKLRDRVTQSSHLMLHWQRTAGPDDEVSVRYYRISDRNNDHFLYAFGPGVPINYDFDSTRDDLEVQVTRGFGDTLRTVYGVHLRRDEVNALGFYFRQPAPTAALQRLFGHAEWRASPDWIVNIGGSVERESVGGNTFAPRASVNWHLAPGHTLRLGAARAYRSPSLFEQHGSWAFEAITGQVLQRNFLAVGEPLRPEKIDSYELGYIGELPQYRASVDVRIFDERLTDRVIQGRQRLVAPFCELLPPADVLPCGDADDTVNGQNLRNRGLEYQLRWRPWLNTRLQLNQSFITVRAWPTAVTSHMSAIDAEKLQEHADQSAPTHMMSLMWMQKLPGNLDFSLIYSNIGAMKWTRQTQTSSYHRLDWRLGVPFQWGRTRGELAFTVRNHRGLHGEFRPSQPVAQRAFASLRLDF